MTSSTGVARRRSRSSSITPGRHEPAEEEKPLQLQAASAEQGSNTGHCS
jgi:hypothetical protein